MDQIRSLPNRFAALFRGRKLDAALEEELRCHIDLATEDNVARGMSPAKARRAALRSFGGLTQIKEIYRQQRGIPMIEQINRDLLFGLRQLHRSPGFAATAIL